MDLKIIRDPVYDYIAIDKQRDGWLLDLLDSREMQRLRHIHQLGVSYLVYPGATHTRLSHALGVLHLMQQALRHLKENVAVSVNGETRRALLAAALLHDVGHGPFSHLLESKLGSGHEQWSSRIVRDESTDVHGVLAKEGIVEHVAALLDEQDVSLPYWQKALISSQLDLDRMDYLLRDSHFTGAGYGRFDCFRLIHTLDIISTADPESGGAPPKERPVWPDKCKYAIEEYLFARYHMYHGVYFHHCTRGYEKLLGAIWDRAQHLVANESSPQLIEAIAPFFQNPPRPTVDQYLRLQEYDVLSQLAIWKDDTRDKVLFDLSQKFLHRKGFKAIEVPTGRLSGLKGHDRIEDVLGYFGKQEGVVSTAPRSYILEDSGAAEPYKPYLWSEKEGQSPILLNDGAGSQDISVALPRLRPITQQDTFVRYYCPGDHRDAISELLRA